MALHRLLVIGLDEPGDRAMIALANAADIERKNIRFFDRSDDINHIIASSFNTEKGAPYYGDSRVILMDNIPQERLLKFRQLSRAMTVSENHQSIDSLDDLSESLIDDWYRNVRFSPERVEEERRLAAEAVPETKSERDQILDLLGTSVEEDAGAEQRGDDVVTVLGPKHRLTDEVTSFMSEVPGKDDMDEVIDNSGAERENPTAPLDFESIDDDPLAGVIDSPSSTTVEEETPDEDPLADLDLEAPAEPEPADEDPLADLDLEADVAEEKTEVDPLAGLDLEASADPLAGLDLEETPEEPVEEDPLAGLDLEAAVDEPGPAIPKETAAPVTPPVRTTIKDEDERPAVRVPKSSLTEYVPERARVPKSEIVPDDDDEPEIVSRAELTRRRKAEKANEVSDAEKARKEAAAARDAAEGRRISSGDSSTMFSDDDDADQAAALAAAPKSNMDFESIPLAEDIMTRDRARAQKVFESDRDMYRRARNPEHSIGHRGRIIVCSGGSGGTGKTAVSWGMWYALILARNESGENDRGTWLIEADYDSPKYQRVHMDMKDTQDLGSFAKLLRSCAEQGTTLTKQQIQDKLVNEFSYYDEDHGGRILACPRDRGDIEDKYLFMAIVQAIRAVSDMGGAVIVDMADSDNRNSTAVNNVILHRLADQIVLTCTPSTAGSVRDLAKNITTADRTGARPYKAVPLGRVHLALIQASDVQAEELQENFFSPLKVDIFIPTIPDLLPTNLPINKMGIGHITMTSKAVKRAVMIRCGSLLVSCGYSDYDKFFRSNPQISAGSSSSRKPGFVERIASRFS